MPETLTLAGLAETNAGMTLASGTDLRVDGSAMAMAARCR